MILAVLMVTIVAAVVVAVVGIVFVMTCDRVFVSMRVRVRLYR